MINEELGTLDGEHLQLLGVQCGVPADLLQKANGMGQGADCPLTTADLPPDVRNLQSQSVKLASVLAAAEPCPVALALDYCRKQGELASKGRDLLGAELARRRASVDTTLSALADQLTPKGRGVDAALAAAGVGQIIEGVAGMNPGLRYRIEIAAKILPLQTAFAVCRDNAERARPAWLVTALRQFEAKKLAKE